MRRYRSSSPAHRVLIPGVRGGRFAPLALLGLALALSGVASAREIRINVLFTTDLHGRMTARELRDGGGLMVIADRVRAIRAEEEQVLLVDCGDTFQGTFESYQSRGRIVLDAMAAIGYDAWVIGKHEFAWGLDALRPLVRDAPFAVLAANLRTVPGRDAPLPQVRPAMLRVMDGVRVVVVGLTHPGIPLWFLPGELEGLWIERPVPALQRIWPEVRAMRPDIVIVAAHMGMFEIGTSELAEVARLFPETDLILGGHTHQEVAGRQVAGALFAQAGAHGNGLGHAVLVYDTVERRVVRRSVELLPVDRDAPADPVLFRTFGRTLARAEDLLGRRIGSASAPLSAQGTDPGGGEIGEMIRAAILGSTGADIVIHGSLSSASLTAGPITERDLWRIVPHEYRLGAAWLTFGEIREILEENLAVEHYRVMGLGGATAVMDAEGKKIARLVLPDGTVPHPRRRFKVVFNSHALASGGGRWMELRRLTQRPEARFEALDVQTRDIVREYIQKNSPLVSPMEKRGGLVPAATN